MKFLLTTAFCFFFVAIGFSQISHFKTLNSADLSSNPTQFTDYNGEVYFLAQNNEYQELWKVDSSGSHISKVIDKPVYRSSIYGNVQDLFTGPDGLYFIVTNGELLNTEYFLYRTNGRTTDSVALIPSAGKIYFAGSNLFFLNGSGLYQIRNGETNLIYHFLRGHQGNYIPQVINDSLYFFDYLRQPNATFSLFTFKAEEEGYQSLFRIDSVIDFGNYQNIGFETAVLNNELFIISNKLNNENLTVQIQLQKYASGQLTFLRNIGSHPLNQFYNGSKINNFKEIANKLLFIHDSREVWISDGTSQGSSLLKSFSGISIDLFNYSIVEIDDHYYLGAAESNDVELWKSDGTPSGTALLANLDSITSSTPHYFRRLGDKFIFRTAADEIWISDGTNSGTMRIGKIPRPLDSQFNLNEVPEFALTSDSILIYKNYSEESGYECWRTDGTLAGTYLLKNVYEGKSFPVSGSQRIILDSVWYFNGVDEHGSELWRSNGTPEGTYMVKDLVPGSGNLNIRSMVKTDSLLFFTAFVGNEGILRLFRSNGTEVGTFEITLESGFSYTRNVSQLTTAGRFLYFTFSTLTGESLWRTDGTQAETRLLSVGKTINNNHGLAGFDDGRLFVGGETYPLIINLDGSTEILDSDWFNPRETIEWKGDIYFKGYFNNFYKTDSASLEITSLGSYSPEGGGSSTRFFAQTASYLFFSGNLNNRDEFDLYKTDGTPAGTGLVKSIPLNRANYDNIDLIAAGDKVFLFIYYFKYPATYLELWVSDGTVDGTSEIFKMKDAASLTNYSIEGSSIYFSFYLNKFGTELWKSDGTNEGTFLVEEIRKGRANSDVSNFMGFNDKIIFTGLSDTLGYALYQYVPTNCEGNRNYAIKSGNWNDSSTWSCGNVPSQIDYAVIDSPYKVKLSPNETAKASNILVKPGAVLELTSGASASFSPKNN